jgi:hypothetical protein
MRGRVVMKALARRTRTALLSCALLLISLTGCGGGTTGSGDAPSVKVFGTVTNPQGTPIPSGTVTDLTSGTTASINSSGGFQLSALAEDGTVSLDVTSQGTSGSIQVKDLPSSTQSVAIKVVVDSVSGIVTLASVEIDVDPTTTGPVTQRVRGTILNNVGKPAKNVTVSISGARGSDKTGSDGSFTLDARSTTGTVKLKISYNGVTGETTIRGIPKDRSCTLRVKLSVSIEAGQDPGDGSEGESTLVVDVDRVSVS